MKTSNQAKRNYSLVDRLLMQSDHMLQTLIQPSTRGGSQGSPAKNIAEADLNVEQRRHSAGLMRVNHTGEVCAQALYQGQALTAKLADVRQEMQQAAKEEVDHLDWCHERLQQLDARPSVLNPIFYGLSFGLGALAGAISDKVSLGFVAATEELVCQHLQKHTKELPEADKKSRAIVAQMLEDEARHQQSALDAGGAQLPMPVKAAMKLTSKVMTVTTYKL